MQQIKRLGHFIDAGNEWLGRVDSFLVLIVVAIVTMEVTLRYGFNSPTTWAWDVNVQLFAAFVFLGAGYHLLHRTIVTVDVLYNRFPPKLRAIADLISCLCCLTFCAVIIWGGTVMAVKSWAVMETSRTFFEPPLYYIKTLIPIGGLLMALQWVRQFITDFAATVTTKKIEGREPGGVEY